jgi:hypothetical protein
MKPMRTEMKARTWRGSWEGTWYIASDLSTWRVRARGAYIQADPIPEHTWEVIYRPNKDWPESEQFYWKDIEREIEGMVVCEEHVD